MKLCFIKVVQRYKIFLFLYGHFHREFFLYCRFVISAVFLRKYSVFSL